MKAITLLLGSFFICTLMNAQFNAGGNVGYSIGKSPTAGLDVGYDLKQINFHGGFIAHMSNEVDKGIVTYVKAGHEFTERELYFTPSIGYAFLYKSSDIKSLNSNELLLSAEIGWKWEFKDESMALYLVAVKAGEMRIINIGIRGYF